MIKKDAITNPIAVVNSYYGSLRRRLGIDAFVDNPYYRGNSLGNVRSHIFLLIW